MVLGHLHGKRHLPGELPLASLGPAHNPGAAAAPPTHTAAQAGPGAPRGRESWWGLGTVGLVVGWWQSASFLTTSSTHCSLSGKPAIIRAAGGTTVGECEQGAGAEPPGLRGRRQAACAGMNRMRIGIKLNEYNLQHKACQQ